MADVSKIKGTDNTTYNIKDATARAVTDTFNVITIAGSSIGSTSGTVTQEQVDSINKNTLLAWKYVSASAENYLRYLDYVDGSYIFTNVGWVSTVPAAFIMVINTSSLTWKYREIVIQPSITGGASTIKSNNLTANRALISNSNGKVAVSGATADDLTTLNKLIFKNKQAYDVGDVCLYSGKLFVCATAKTASQTSSEYYPSTSEDTTYWTRVFIS